MGCSWKLAYFKNEQKNRNQNQLLKFKKTRSNSSNNWNQRFLLELRNCKTHQVLKLPIQRSHRRILEHHLLFEYFQKPKTEDKVILKFFKNLEAHGSLIFEILLIPEQDVV
jgi:hypothetical protein